MARTLSAEQVKQTELPEAPVREATRRQNIGRFFRSHVLPRLFLIPVCLFFLLPLYWMVAVALKSNEELNVYPPTWWPETLQWSNFSDAINMIPFGQYFENTAVITVFTVIGAAISNPLIAYGFSRLDWPGRDKVFMLVLATVFVPYPVLIVALFDIFARLGWINTILPLVVPMFFGNAFWIFLMRQFFLRIPRELTDAARLDGAGDLRILFQIILPQSYAAIAVVCLFAALHAWNDFLGPYLYLLNPEEYTLSIGLTFFQSSTQYDVHFNLLMAASVMIILPVVALFLMFQRTFIEGVQLGSIK